MYIKNFWVKAAFVDRFIEELERQKEFVKVLKLPYVVKKEKIPQDLQDVAGTVFCAEIVITEEHETGMVRREVIDKLLDATGFYPLDIYNTVFSFSFDIGADIAEVFHDCYSLDEESIRKARRILHSGVIPAISISSYFEIARVGNKEVLEKDGSMAYRRKAKAIIAYLLKEMIMKPAIPDLSPFTDLVGASDPHIESTSKWEKLCEMIPGLECLGAELRELGDRPEARSGSYTPLEYQSTVRKIFRLLIKVIVDNANAKVTAEE